MDYKINSGDTLWGIAQKYGGGGGNWGQISSMNPGLNPRALKVGQTIKLPGNWSLPGSSSQSSIPQPASSNSSNSSSPNFGSGPGYNYNQNLQGVKAMEDPQMQKTNQDLLDQINNINTQFNTAKDTGNSIINTINQNTANQTAQNNTALQGTIKALQQSQQDTEQQMGQQHVADLGAVTAANVANGYGGTTASETVGGGDNSQTGMLSGQQPFVQSEIAAANQPYFQSLKTLNDSVAVQIAQANKDTVGLNTQLQNASQAQIASIGNELLQLAPQQAQAIANIHVQMAQIDQQYQQGEIDQATAISQLQQLAYNQQQQIDIANKQIQVSMIQAQAAQTQAQAALNSSTAAITQANAAMKTAQKQGLIPVQEIPTSGQYRGQKVVSYYDPSTGQVSFQTPDPNGELWNAMMGIAGNVVNGSSGKSGGSSSSGGSSFLNRIMGGGPDIGNVNGSGWG